MKTLVLIASFLCFSISFAQNDFRTLKQSSEIAVKSNKGILLVHVNSEESRTSISKKIDHLKNTFVIHYVDISENSGLTEEQKLLNKRLEGSYNTNKVYPTITVLGKYAEKKGVQFSGTNNNALDQFIKSLKSY